MEMHQIAGLVVAPILAAPLGGALNVLAHLTMGIALPTFTVAAALCAIGTLGFGIAYSFEYEWSLSLVCGGLTALAAAFFAGYSIGTALYTGALVIFTIALIDYKLGQSMP